jgi:hypothetical protein
MSTMSSCRSGSTMALGNGVCVGVVLSSPRVEVVLSLFRKIEESLLVGKYL